jgi:YfiH family protein
VSPYPFDLNLSYNVGDDSNNIDRNRRVFFDTLGISESACLFPSQEHSVNVVIATNPGHVDHCDSVITVEKDLFIAISVADCVPVLVYNSKLHIVAGIHAGWRGTVKKIVKKTIEKMIDLYHCRMEDIYAFIGPSAGVCCYEVGKDVARHFSPVYSSAVGNGKWKVDLKMENYHQLTGIGVPEKNIEVHPDCTICCSSLYHSFRRDGKQSGRMLACIGMISH